MTLKMEILKKPLPTINYLQQLSVILASGRSNRMLPNQVDQNILYIEVNGQFEHY